MASDFKVTRSKGGNYHPISMRDFVISHLARLGEDYPANVHRAYVEELKILEKEKGRRKPYHKPAYSSFYSNFHKLALEGLVVFSGREEESDKKLSKNLGVKVMRKYFRLAGPGSAAHQVSTPGNLPLVIRDVHEPVSKLVDYLKNKPPFASHQRSSGLKSP